MDTTERMKTIRLKQTYVKEADREIRLSKQSWLNL